MRRFPFRSARHEPHYFKATATMSEETTLDINGDAFSQHSFASEIVMHIIYSFLSVHNTLRFIQFPLLLLPLWPLLNALTEKVGGIFIPI